MTLETAIKPPCFLRLSDEEYHADPVPGISLSASIATMLVSRSPLHAFYAHPRLGGRPRVATEEMELGTLLHAMLLGKGADLEVIEAPDFKTKAAREARDAARAAGKIPMIAHKVEAINVMLREVQRQFRELGIVLDGESEITAIWEEESDCGPVACRGKLDHLIEDRGLIIDLKTGRSAHPDAFARSAVEYGADIQHAAYVSALEHIRPDLAGRISMEFVVIETEWPFPVSRIAMDGSMRELGERRWRRAVERWAACLSAGTTRDCWPGYMPNGGFPLLVEAPGWALHREEAMEEGEGI